MIALLIAFTVRPVAARLNEKTLAKLGEVLTEDRVFYRWQSTESGENLARLGTMDEATNSYFMRRTGGIVFGPGIYLAGTPTSSASYMPVRGGNLIEVRIKKGTRVIDVEDPATLAKIKKLGMTTGQLEDGAHAPNGVLIKYDADYYVGKNLAGRANFALFPSGDVTADQVTAWHRAIREDRAGAQFLAQVRARQPGIMAKIDRDVRTADVALGSMAPADAIRLLRRKFDEPLPMAEVLRTWEVVSQRPDVTALALRDAMLGPRVVHDTRLAVMANAAGKLTLNPGYTPMLRKFIDQSSADDPNQRAALKALVNVILNDPHRLADPNGLARELAPLVARIEFTPNEARSFAGKIALLMDTLEPRVEAAPALRTALEAAHVDDPTLLARVDRLTRRRALIDQALRTHAAGDVTEALRASGGMREVAQSFAQMEGFHGRQFLVEGLNAFARTHETEFASLLRTDADFAAVTKLATEVGQPHLLDLSYHRALAAGPAAREAYFNACVGAPECRPRLIEFIKRDDGRIFRDAFDPRVFVNRIEDLRSLDPAAGRELTKLIITTTKSPAEFERLVRALDHQGLDVSSRKLLIDQARARGFANFRSADLLGLRRFAAPGSPAARDLLRGALDVAVEPRDVLAVARAARAAPAGGIGLNVALAKRLGELGPRPEDIAAFGELRLAAPAVKVGDGARDCLNILTRWVGQ